MVLNAVGLATECVFDEGLVDDNFNSRIMHQHVSPRLFVAKVECIASVELIARRFGINEGYVRKHWLTQESLVCEVEQVGATNKPKCRRSRTVLSRPVDVDGVTRRLRALSTTPEVECASAGFARTHGDVELSCGSRLATRRGRMGTYRNAQGSADLGKAVGKASFFEVEVIAQENRGGICVGVAPENYPLNSLVGSARGTVGLFSTGQVVQNNQYGPTRKPFGVGDVVGVSAKIIHLEDSPVTASDSSTGSDVDASASVVCLPDRTAQDSVAEIEMWLNGERLASGRILLACSSEEALVPTVSIYSEGSAVRIRC